MFQNKFILWGEIIILIQQIFQNLGTSQNILSNKNVFWSNKEFQLFYKVILEISVAKFCEIKPAFYNSSAK